MEDLTMVKLFGVSTNKENVKGSLDKLYDLLIDDEGYRTLYVSKDTFTQDDFNGFEYKLVIEKFVSEDTKEVTLVLYIVPLPKYIKNGDWVTEFDYEPTIEDCFSEGFAVPLSTDTFQADKYTDEMLDTAAYVGTTVNSLRGFYLDRVLNFIGNNGWNYLEWFICDKDLFESLNRE